MIIYNYWLLIYRWKRAIQIPFHQSLVSIALVLSEEKIFEKVYDVRRRWTPSDGNSYKFKLQKCVACQDLPALQFWSKSHYPFWSYYPFFIKCPSTFHILILNMPNLHNRYKLAERKISHKNPEHMLNYSLPCSCS
jgi:hypothetical protein